MNDDRDNVINLIAGQLPRSRTGPATVVITDPDMMVIRKAITVCTDSGLPVPDENYFELQAEGKYHGPACTCYKCRREMGFARRKFR